MIPRMSRQPFRATRDSLRLTGIFLFAVALEAQAPASADAPVNYDADANALILARRYLEGGDGSRAALLEALQHMGWGVRNAQGVVLKAPPAGADTGLAMRDYELEELLWNPAEQPTIRLISVAQALAVPFEDADPEELAQDLVDTIRKSAESGQPQQRFWSRFIIALGRVSPANYDLGMPAPAAIIPPDPAQLKRLETEALTNPFALLKASQPTPVWADDDPVLAPSPRPVRDDDETRPDAAERDQKRMNEISDEMQKLLEDHSNPDPKRQQAAQDKMAKLTAEMTAISTRQQAAAMQQMNSAMKKFKAMADDEDEEESGDEESDGSKDDGPRFVAEWRDQPLSLLQVALISRVLAADVRQAAMRGAHPSGQASLAWPRLPLAALRMAQAGGPPTSFSGQFSGAAGDLWATGWGAYTGEVLEHHLPNNKFSKGVGIANTIIAWFKTIMTVARQKITIEVENAPLVRTKTRSPGQQRTARAKVEIDFPKSDVLKAIRAAGNLTTIDLQMPDGGPVSGARVVWRLPEGSYNGKYQTANGGSQYRPDLAVVQFAQAGGPAAYISYTNDDGEATITLEGVPQRRLLPPTVRPYPRRAAVAVEVTIKVGNLTQDLNDAISTAMGGPIAGGLSFIADMVLRTSFFFQKSKVFEVTDWKEPAWEGRFEITVKGSGSKHEKGEKGGPDQDNTWSLDRYMEGRLHTPDWEEENEEDKEYANDGRHKLEVHGDSRYFRLNDSSSSKSRNSHNRYEAIGPMQIQPPGRNQLELHSRAEPSGSAELIFNGGMMQLELRPFFGAECIVGRSEQGRGRNWSKAGPEYLSLLGGVYPEHFTIIEPNDGSSEVIEGTKTFDYYNGSLPYVPGFDVVVTVKYQLWKNGPPPKNKAR
ncbi:MAG: hypothetical protein QG602_2916 [Verrucomicrobiota bacterium]|nr:hypothetical protein [Verrucomicrobiota bacterium]